MIEVKAGYKQTALGVIPEDWDVLSIEELITKGFIEKPLDGNHGNIHPKSGDFVDNGIPFVMANNVYSGFVDLNSCHFIRKEQADSLQKGFSITGDVLLTHKGTVGNVAIVGKIDTEYIMLTPQVTYYRVKNSNAICNTYIKQYFLSNTFQEIIKNISGGGTRAYIGITSQRQLPFVLPSIKEQNTISTVLSDTDALIDHLEKLIAKKKAIKQGVMQQLLTGKKRLPGFKGRWEVKTLGGIAVITRGASPRPIDSPIWFDDKSKIGWVRISDVTKSTKILKYTTQKLSDLGVKHSRFIGKGNLIMSICATVGRPIFTELDVCIHDGFVVFANPKIKKEYLYYFLSFVENDWSKNGQTGSQMNLNTGLINSTKIAFPKSKSEQSAIVTILSDMNAEIEALERKRDKYTMIKQGMMQQLLTGRIRTHGTN